MRQNQRALAQVDAAITSAEAKELHLAQIAAETERIKERYQYKSARLEPFAVLTGIVVVGSLLLALGYGIYQATAGPSASQQLEERAREKCDERGWVFIPNVGNTEGVDLCLPVKEGP